MLLGRILPDPVLHTNIHAVHTLPCVHKIGRKACTCKLCTGTWCTRFNRGFKVGLNFSGYKFFLYSGFVNTLVTF